MTKDEALKLAQEVCPYFDEISKGAFYDGFITALDHIPDATKMMGLIPSEWAGLDEPPNSTTDVVEPEPAAYAEIKNGYPRSWLWNSEYVKANSNVKVTLYAAPPNREWVGLTDEEREYLWSITPIEDEDRFAFVLAVEAKLKEKNT